MVKILIVDDNEDDLEYLKMLVNTMGYETTAVNNGRDALAILKKEKFDLVLLDILMPGMSGKEVLAAIRKDPEIKDQKVAFLTVVRLTEPVHKSIEELNPIDYIEKPVTLEGLKNRLKEIMGE